MDDLIGRQAAVEALCDNCDRVQAVCAHYPCKQYIAVVKLPSVQPEWNNHTVACLLAELFDDDCACNYNGIDEWLPSRCELLDSCPHSVGVACWEQFLTYRKERRTDE